MSTALDSLNKEKTGIQSKLNASNTAFGTFSGKPGSSDLSLSTQLASINKQIEDQRSKELRNKMYGKSTTETAETATRPGGIMGAIRALQMPLNSIVGASQYALGKGTESDLLSNVGASVKEGRTWGNVLAQYNLPRWLQIGAGFALDVATDPVNWATLGTESLLPRAATGLIKGGAREGALTTAGKGITSWGEKVAADTLNLVPFVQKIGKKALYEAPEGAKLTTGQTLKNIAIKGSAKYGGLAERLSAKAIKSATRYDEMIGKTYLDDLGKMPLTGISSGIVGDTAEKFVKWALPKAKAEKLIDFVKYSPAQYAKAIALKDKAGVLAKEKMGVSLVGEKVADFPTISAYEDVNAQIKWPVTETTAKVKNVADTAVAKADDIIEKVPTDIRYKNTDTIPEGFKVGDVKKQFRGHITIANTQENAASILDSYADLNIDRETMDKLLTKAYHVTEKGQTGFKAYDDVIENLKNTTFGGIVNATSRTFGGGDILTRAAKDGDELIRTWNSYGKVMDIKPFEKFLNAYPVYISAFKLAKVALNTGSHVIANMGNFFMGAMMGLPVHTKEFIGEIVNSRRLLSGKMGYRGIREQVAIMADMIKNDPTQFKNTFGMEVSELLLKLKIGDDVLNSGNVFEDLGKYLDSEWYRTEGAVEAATMLDLKEKAIKGNKLLDKSFPTASGTILKTEKLGSVTDIDKGSSMIGNEAAELGKIQEWKDRVAKSLAADPTNPVYALSNFIINKMPIAYERIDQSWKMGTTNYLIKYGLSRGELNTISRSVKLGPGDFLGDAIEVGAEKRYRLTPQAGARVATEAFMNYSAMPDVVKMLRAIPFAGSSFFSFPYAMAVRMGKTALDNPAAFNKIAFMMNEMNAGRTPQERMALENKYNQYMKSDTVIKIAGMWNVNMKNLIPYYSMNMFNPSERNYDTTSAMGQVFRATDKLPFFQDPIGQIMKDYLIQPWMLSGTVGYVSQGQFGQPLFPSFDENGNPIKVGVGTRALYGGKAAVESVVPGVFGYAGLLNSLAGVGPEVINKLPLGYGFTGMANATQGRSSIGAITKEDPFRKTLKTAISRSGIPSYLLDPTMTSQ